MPSPASLFVLSRLLVLRGIFICLAMARSVAFADESNGAKEQTTENNNKVSFVRQVAPLLVKHCIACHGEKNPEGEYQLYTFARAIKEGASASPVIVAGKPKSSALYRLIATDDPDERMPHEAEPLAKEHTELIGRWIEEGASFDGPDTSAPLASIIPRPEHPEPPANYPRPVPVTALAISPDSGLLASSGYHELLLWNLSPSATGSASGSSGATGSASVDSGATGSASDSSDGASKASALESTDIARGTQASTGSASGTQTAPYSLTRRIKNIAQRTHSIAFSPDGTLLAVATGTPGRLGEVKLFNPQTGELVAELAATSDEMFDVEFTRDGTRLAACGADRTIRLYDLAERKEFRRIEAHADWVMAVAWSPDGAKLASAGRDKTAKVIDAATGTVLVTYPGHDEQVFDVLFSANGEQVFSAGRGRELHRWNTDGKSTSKSDVRKKETGGIVGRTGGDIHKLLLSGSRVLAATSDGKLSEFDPEQKDKTEPVLVYEGAPQHVFAIAYREDTRRLAAGGFDGLIATYDGGAVTPRFTFIAAPGLASPSVRFGDQTAKQTGP